jgi:4-amino-4-deoxy-L-arabinose transferase-like glycosyltransferase
MAGLTSFHEQPPLVFGIQALFFKLLGNSMYVERFYTFLTTVITAVLIIIFWKMVFKNEIKLKQFAWLPVIIWITIPVAFWSYSNNMNENTMGVFTLAAAIFIFKALESNKFITWLLAGVFIFLATLSKGLPGFFPIAIPFLYWLIIKRTDFKKIVYGTVLTGIVLILIYVILFCLPASRESLSLYFFKRALSRINEVPTVTSRFYILYSLVSELLPQLIILALILFIGRTKKIKIEGVAFFRPATFFIAIGLAGTLPLMLTLVQKGFYYVPALPFFAIGFSILMAPAINYLVERINVRSGGYKLFLTVSMAALLISVFFSFDKTGKLSRDKDTLHDIYTINKIVPKFSVITIPTTLWNDWSLQCYLMRYSNTSLDTISGRDDFYLKEKSIGSDTVPDYKRVDVVLDKYELYSKK